MSSIRKFLILITLAAVTLVIFIAALQGYRSGVESTSLLLDEQLEAFADILINSRSVDTTDSDHSHLMQVVDSNGEVVQRSVTAPDVPLVSADEGFCEISHDGIMWRVLARRSLNGDMVVIGEHMVERYAVADSVVLKALIPIVLMLPVIAFLIGGIVTLGLRPLKRLAQEVGTRRAQNLAPIHVDELPQELEPLQSSMNTLLGRVEESYDRERRFSSDAAHELRTPVSAIRVNLFNLQKKLPKQDEDLRECHQATKRMEHLIEQLLMLYRMSSEQAKLSFEVVELNELARNAIADCYPAISDRNQEISLEGSLVHVKGGVFALSALIKNLVDNARKYTPRGGQIRVLIEKTDHEARLIVEDNGPGIPENQRGRVWERFCRLSTDKDDLSQSGCGLGLSIVRHVVQIHSGKAELKESSLGRGLRVEITLPRLGDSGS